MAPDTTRTISCKAWNSPVEHPSRHVITKPGRSGTLYISVYPVYQAINKKSSLLYRTDTPTVRDINFEVDQHTVFL